MRENEIHVGDLIFYKLRPSDHPINPNEEYRAVVKKKKFIEPNIWMLYVQARDQGFYEDSTEWIFLAQVTRKVEGEHRAGEQH